MVWSLVTFSVIRLGETTAGDSSFNKDLFWPWPTELFA